ncbi:MAG: SMC family ATPase [Synechococcales cyanobacterium C42_A2020_086]|jgi:exonuclease SbcC|nr:SMC family ATPase [Synechococcales cyanobacterium C42_A2020_086]
MEILSVTLKNFKSHSDRHFVFQPGTNAICGENGAGKTSVLEAIAWVLFNHRGAYKNEDFIRNGSGTAQVKVTFVSHRDGRTYEVQRCTTKGYTLYDPQLGVRLDYKHVEDEVLPWLRQQLGVAPGTDLARLFANTIGVPQGTFTVDFLQSPEKRKPIFDAVLKVEDYRQANQQMLSLEKYARAESEALERSIAQYDNMLLEWSPLQARHQALQQDISTGEATLQMLQGTLATLQAEKECLSSQAQQVQQLQAQMQQFAAQAEGKQQAVALLQQAVQQSREAVEICRAQRHSYQTYLQAEAALKQLDQQIKQQQALFQQRELQQQQLSAYQADLTRLTLQLEQLDQAAAELEQLRPLIEQQTQLEQQQSEIAEQLNRLQASKLEQQSLSRQLQQLQHEQNRLQQDIDRIRGLEASVQHLNDYEQKRDRLQQQLSRIEAAKQFEADLRQLVTLGEAKRDQHQAQAEQALMILRQMQHSVPLLATASMESVLGALEAGIQLNTELINDLWRILGDLAEQTSVTKLQQQLGYVKTQLEELYQQRGELATLGHKLAQQQHWQAEMTVLQQRWQQLQVQLATEADWQQQRMQIAAELHHLGNPQGRYHLLEQHVQQRPALVAQQQTLHAQYAVLQQTLDQIEQQLDQFAQLAEQLDQQQQVRHSHQSGYLLYLQHQKDANQLAALEAELQTAMDQLQQLQQQRDAAQAEYEQWLQTYDPQRWQQVEAEYNEVRSQADRLAGSLPQQRKLLQELDSQLEALQAVKQKRDAAQRELKQKEKVRKFISFARKAYKDAGPRITERYVQSISREADRLFRELLNRPNVALEWTRDYEILVQEGAHTRRFINLSGGEQMCAALAVRLALLRVLADIDIAFFDEPTTNMDRPRRESLAEAIANIKTFRQLFVISHDDTFEKVTENVIMIEREI